MVEKFDLAPIDKSVADPEEDAAVDLEMHAKLEAGLIDTFATSDPIRDIQPVASKHHGEHASFWDKLKAIFK